jgi:hypothetical protein
MMTFFRSVAMTQSMNTASAASSALLDYLKEQQKAQMTSAVTPPTATCPKVSKAVRRSRKSGLAFASPTASSSQSATKEDDEVEEDSENDLNSLCVEALMHSDYVLTKTIASGVCLAFLSRVPLLDG